jgi:hypothetical protein
VALADGLCGPSSARAAAFGGGYRYLLEAYGRARPGVS